MKHITLALLLCTVVSTGLFAQLSKGNLFVGPTVGAFTYGSGTNDFNYTDSSFKTTTNHNFGIGLTPQIGVFLTDHVVLGGMLTFNLASDKQNINNTEGKTNTNDSKNNSFTVNAGPFLRYYFFSSTPGNTVFFAQADARVGTGTGKTTGSGENDINNFTSTGKTSQIFSWNAGGSIGVTHFINKRIGMDVSAGYDYGKNKSHNTTTVDNVSKTGSSSTVTTTSYDFTGSNNNFRVGVGFHWFLSSHKS